MARQRKGNRRLRYLKTYDVNLILSLVFLIAFGFIMIYSASYYVASVSAKFDYNPTYLIESQIKYTLVGIVGMFLVANFDYRKWRYLALPGFIIAILLVLLLLVPGLGVTVKGATRWLRIPGIGQFQVAEPIKIAIILFSAAIISGNISKVRGLKNFVQLALPTGGISILILLITNNLSTAIIVMGITLLMLFTVHPKWFPFIAIVVVAMSLILFGIWYLKTNPPNMDENFRLDRVMAWLDPYAYEGDQSYQSLQGLYAIGSGSLFGKGLGNSIQKLGRLPEPYNDMIFCILCEELGIFGAGIVILLFIYLLYRIYLVAQQADDFFGQLLAMGVFFHVSIQVVLNLFVVTGIFPITGVTLPFFSHGGTASFFLLVEMGMVLNIEKSSRLRREEEIRKARMS